MENYESETKAKEKLMECVGESDATPAKAGKPTADEGEAEESNAAAAGDEAKDKETGADVRSSAEHPDSLTVPQHERKDDDAESANLSDDSEANKDVYQAEIDELEGKLADLQQELNLSQEEFEARLMKKLQHEIKFNRNQLESDLKNELASEKKRLLQAAVSRPPLCSPSVTPCLLAEPRERRPQSREPEAPKRDLAPQDPPQRHRKVLTAISSPP